MKNFLFILFPLICITLHGQEPYTIHYTINDGLPTNTIYSAFKDSKGYVWFASDVGIIKYDSYNFELFNTDNGLTGNEVFKIKEDYKGRKWLLTLNGTPAFIKNEKIYNHNNSTLIKKIKSNSLLIDFYQDSDNTIYLVSKNGTISMIKDSLVENLSISKTNASGVWKNNNQLSILTNEGIYNTDTRSIQRLPVPKIPYRVFHQKKKTYYNDTNVLYRLNENNQIEKVLELPKETEIIDIYEESNNKLWVCSRKGLFLYKNKILEKHYFKNETVTSIILDIEGNYWVTTLSNGIYLVPSFNILRRKLKINTIAKKSPNEIWFGGAKNDFYIKKGKTFVHNEFNNKWRKDNISKIRFFGDITYIIGKVGTYKITSKQTIKTLISVNDLLLIKDTLFLATTYSSIINSKDLDVGNYDIIHANKILERRSNVLEKGANNTIFIGTNLGLYSYSSKNGISFLGHKNDELKSSIKALLFNPNTNLLLVATSSKGLIILKNKKAKYSLSKLNGLNNNTVTSIGKMTDSTYLVGSNKGLNLLTLGKNKLTLENYNSALGFKNKKINAISYVSDTIYIATNNNLLYFNQSYFKKNTSQPISIIKDIYSNNIRLEKSNLFDIDYKKNDIKIEFTGISYLDEGNLDFYFKLNDNNWSTTKQTQVNYESLTPNSYKFSLYSVNGLGQKSKIEVIEFSIKKPFWKKWWFLLLTTILISFVVIYFINARIKKANKQFEKEKKSLLLEKENIELENQMLALEQKALRLQMNPHFIFNALNTIKGYYSEGNVQDASDYISNFSKLLRLLLENVEQYISLAIEIKMLDLYLQLTQVRYQFKFKYRIKIDKKINEEEIGIPTLLMQPIIENAIIHGIAPKSERGNILISFDKKENMLICSVTDNGIGRKATFKNKRNNHTSKALKITKERLNLIEVQEKTTCNLEFIDLYKNQKANGTKVIISIPIINIY